MDAEQEKKMREAAAAAGVDPDTMVAAAKAELAKQAPVTPPRKDLGYTVDDLLEFEAVVAKHFEAGEIRAPVHLSGGNEAQLLELFQRIDRENDWVCTNWRSHYHCLLKGVPRGNLLDDILKGRSITLCYPEHKIISSAIVGGMLPIATGIAAALRRDNKPGMVWAFMGDMAGGCGVFSESGTYAAANRLPITFVVESNNMSVMTPTKAAWGPHAGREPPQLLAYEYQMSRPHQGTGKRVEF